MKKNLLNLVGALLAASVGVSANAGVMTFTQGSTNDLFIRDDYPQTGDRFTSSVSGVGAKGSFSAWAKADYGSLKVFATGAATENTHAASVATASVSDYITLNNAALHGKKGQFSVTFYSHSILSADNYTPWGSFGSAANYNLDIMMGTSYLGIQSSRLLVNQSLRVDDDPAYTTTSSRLWDQDVHGITDTAVTGNYFTLTQEFVWGTPVHMQINMWVDGFFGNYPYYPYTDVRGSFRADGGNSTYWDGIKSVMTDGVEITDYALLSGSGTDYSRSFVPEADVPEPATFAALGIGWLAMLASRRRFSRAAVA